MIRKLRKLKVKYEDGEYENPLEDVIKKPEQLYKIFKGMEDETQEKFIAVYFDDKNRIMSYSLISLGDTRIRLSSPYDVMKKAILLGSVNIAILHNHPDGTCKPNKQDMISIEFIRDGVGYLKMKLLDYIIVGKESFWSLHKKGDGKEYVVAKKGGLKWPF